MSNVIYTSPSCIYNTLFVQQNIAANNILFNRGFNNNSNTNSNNYYKDFKVPSFYNRANSLINYDSSNIYGALNNKPLKIYGTNYDYGFV